jgi:hypothetical protein
MARSVLGTIDLDPASDERAQQVVQAGRWLGIDNADEWPHDCSVFLNPPGGLVCRKSQALLFWNALAWYRMRLRLRHAIFVAFNAELLRSSQIGTGPSIADPAFVICAPRQRIAFCDPVTGQRSKSPTHHNLIVYVPGMVDQSALFAQVFGTLGAILRGV